MVVFAPIPQFGQLVEYITQGILINDIITVIINRVSMEDIFTSDEKGDNSFLKPLVLNALKSDYAKVSQLRNISNLEEVETDVMKSVVGKSYHTDVVALSATVSSPVELVDMLSDIVSKPIWNTELVVKIGEVYLYTPDKNLYEVIQSHTTQSGWTPTIAKSLFKRYYEPSDDPWAWVQPTGAHDAYPAGAKVLYNVFTWENTIAANVWVPGVVGWTNLTPPEEPEVSPWKQPIGASDAYNIGDRCTFNGHLWESKINTNVWSPSAYPAGWKDLGIL